MNIWLIIFVLGIILWLSRSKKDPKNPAEKLKIKREAEETALKLAQRLHEFIKCGDSHHNFKSSFQKITVNDPEEREQKQIFAKRFNFQSENQIYFILLYDRKYRYWYYDDDDLYIELLEIYHESNEKIFSAKLKFRDDEWSDYYRGRDLQAFIPGPWVNQLVEILTSYEKEKAERRVQYETEQKQKREQEIIKNFGG